MKKELELKLVEKYPVIFQEYGGDIRKTCMGWGFSCGDGWYGIIDRLCSDINTLIEGTECKVVAVQVKEKFGGLRFYFMGIDCGDLYKEVSNLVDEAEAKSLKTCEECGEAGTIRDSGWLITLCNKCNGRRLSNG